MNILKNRLQREEQFIIAWGISLLVTILE